MTIGKIVAGLACSLHLLCAGANALAGVSTFFVSAAGNDQNDGRDPARAWRTADHVNKLHFTAGDSILFQRGGDWHEQLIASSSGTAELPITYGDYGDPKAAKPTFWGSDIILATAFKSIGNSIYTAPLNALPTRIACCVFIDHEFIHAAASSSDLPAKSFFVDSSTIYLNSGGADPTKGEVVITASDRAQGVNADSSLICSNGHDNLVFKNLIGRETAAVDFSGHDVPDAYVFRIQGSSNVRLDHCEAYNGGKHHIGVINSTGFVGTSLHAAGCLPGLGFGHAGAFVSFSDESRHGDTSEWIDCRVDHFDPAQQSFITHGPGLGRLLIKNLTSVGCSLGIGTDGPGEVVRIAGGVLDGPTCDVYGKNIVIDGMRITGDGKIDLFGDGNIVQNCIDDRSTNNQAGVVCRGKGNIIRFNTLSHNGGGVPAIDVKATAENTQIIGNLFTGGGRAINDQPGRGLMVSYNFYDNRASAPLGLEGDKHLMLGNPLFDSPTAVYALRLGSPAIDKIPASEIHGVTTDFAGHPRLAGSAYDVGALEAQVSDVAK